MEDSFELEHDKGKLIAVVTIQGETYRMDVTEYFDKANAHDDWLDYRIGLEDMAKSSKLRR